MKNIELKIGIENFQQIRALLKSADAQNIGILKQVDTYYNTKQGRLKLREINNSEFVLIYYKRPDAIKAKLSNYELLSVEKDQLEKLKLMLKCAFGEKIVVKKKRELWLLKNTRIHLDKVVGLGSFLELETVAKDNIKIARKEYKEIFNLLGLNKYKKYKKSYSDMLLNVKK